MTMVVTYATHPSGWWLGYGDGNEKESIQNYANENGGVLCCKNFETTSSKMIGGVFIYIYK